MSVAANLGFPRVGAKRELKKGLEDFWSGKINEEALQNLGRSLRRDHWLLQKKLGIEQIPSNDFSFYDHVLDTAVMVGAVPSRYGAGNITLSTYFAMARGLQKQGELDLPAMEMTKWFDTNYHYIVPEFEAGQRFRLASTKLIDEFKEALSLGILTRPVLLGPISFLLLGKSKTPGANSLNLLDSLLNVYEELLQKLSEAGAKWIQIDEPFLVCDLNPEAQKAFHSAYSRIRKASGHLRILVATYFGALDENLKTAVHLPIDALHLDLVRAPSQLEKVLDEIPSTLTLSLGVVDGRNVWRTNLQRALDILNKAQQKLGTDRIIVAPSCSLLHTPVDLDLETTLDEEIKSWLAFSKQKIEEVVSLNQALQNGVGAVAAFQKNKEVMQKRETSSRIHDKKVAERVARITNKMSHRSNSYSVRRPFQQAALGLPLFPTTTIGSFPQTSELRAARAQFKAGKTTLSEYEAYLRTEIEKTIRFQEEADIDLLVHGEAERNDMVEYFGEQLRGFISTKNGWVQSYGSRCVKPPLIFGDVARQKPMTVEWTQFAQSLTKKPVKGMLTGPITILKWSFVRDDQPLSVTCRQIALAIRDEVCDLEAAGIQAIQIDEPAIREGLPLRRKDWSEYLAWAVEAFRISTAGVTDATQIHTHMCYSEFNDIIEAIAAMDADVISIETSRSQMELLNVFARYQYPNEIGPGVYDIHSPRIPSQNEMEMLLKEATKVLSPSQIWVNPDCGLKTRGWTEVRPALNSMVAAAKSLRAMAGK